MNCADPDRRGRRLARELAGTRGSGQDQRLDLATREHRQTQIEHAARQFGQQTRYAPQQIGS